jgi:hypothetical protein
MVFARARSCAGHVGATGGFTVVCATLLEPGDEVLILARSGADPRIVGSRAAQ